MYVCGFTDALPAQNLTSSLTLSLPCAQVFTTTPTVTKTTSITPCWQWATEWPPRGRSTGSSRTGGSHHLSERHQVAHKAAKMKRQVVLMPPVGRVCDKLTSWNAAWLPAMLSPLSLSNSVIIFSLPLTAGARAGATRATSWWPVTAATSAASPTSPATPSCERTSVELRGRQQDNKGALLGLLHPKIHLNIYAEFIPTCQQPLQNRTEDFTVFTQQNRTYYHMIKINSNWTCCVLELTKRATWCVVMSLKMSDEDVCLSWVIWSTLNALSLFSFIVQTSRSQLWSAL